MELTYVCFTDYDETIPNNLVAFKKGNHFQYLGESWRRMERSRQEIAETEKYAHVTLFL